MAGQPAFCLISSFTDKNIACAIANGITEVSDISGKSIEMKGKTIKKCFFIAL